MLQFTSGQTLPGAFPNTAVKRLRVRLVAMAPHVDEGPQPAGAIPRVRRGGERRRRRNAPDPAPTPRGIPGRRPYRICLGLPAAVKPPPAPPPSRARRALARQRHRQDPAGREATTGADGAPAAAAGCPPTVSRRLRLGGAGEMSGSLLPVEIISARAHTHTHTAVAVRGPPALPTCPSAAPCTSRSPSARQPALLSIPPRYCRRLPLPRGGDQQVRNGAGRAGVGLGRRSWGGGAPWRKTAAAAAAAALAGCRRVRC